MFAIGEFTIRVLPAGGQLTLTPEGGGIVDVQDPGDPNRPAEHVTITLETDRPGHGVSIRAEFS